MRRREGDGCPIAGALQLVGDKWTMLVVRDLSAGPKRTTELLADLFPISSRTLLGRLRDMEKDGLLDRIDYGGLPQRVEYSLTERGLLLLPLLDALQRTGEVLECNQCADRKRRQGSYCDICPEINPRASAQSSPEPRSAPPPRRELDDSIVLL